MVKCAIYPRKSKQVDNSDSMETQIAMCIQYLDAKYGKDNYSVTVYDNDYGIYIYIHAYTYMLFSVGLLFSVADCVIKLCSQISVGGDDEGQQRPHTCTTVPKAVDSKRGRSG